MHLTHFHISHHKMLLVLGSTYLMAQQVQESSAVWLLKYANTLLLGQRNVLFLALSQNNTPSADKSVDGRKPKTL